MLSRMNPNAGQDWNDPVLQVLGVQLKLCVNSSRTEMPIDFFPFCVIKDPNTILDAPNANQGWQDPL